MFPPDQSAVPEQLSPTVTELTSLAHDTVQQVNTAGNITAGNITAGNITAGNITPGTHCTVWVVKYSNDDRATWIVLSFLVINKIVFQLRDLHSNR